MCNQIINYCHDVKNSCVLFKTGAVGWFLFSLDHRTNNFRFSRAPYRLSPNKTFSCTFSGGLSTTAIVKVLVSDVNDNHPVFYPREYNVSVSENRNGASFASPIVAVAATDEDSGKFGIVSYRIVSGNEGNVFRVDRTTGEIFVTQPKVLSAKARYKLIVSAMDGAGLKSESDAEVHISITDASRSPLLFERPKYKFEMREDAKRNSVVGTVKVAQRSGEFYFLQV